MAERFERGEDQGSPAVIDNETGRAAGFMTADAADAALAQIREDERFARLLIWRAVA